MTAGTGPLKSQRIPLPPPPPPKPVQQANAAGAASAPAPAMRGDSSSVAGRTHAPAATDSAMPWEPKFDQNKPLNLTFRRLSAAALDQLRAMDFAKPDIRPYFDETCVVATFQQQLAETNPELYAKTRDGVANPPHVLKVPNPDAYDPPISEVPLEEHDIAFLEEQAAQADPELTPEQKDEMYMQYALMKLAAVNGGATNMDPEAIASGATDAVNSEGEDEHGRSAKGLDDDQMSRMTNAFFGDDSLHHIHRTVLQGDPENAGKVLQERASLEGGTTITVDNGDGYGHAVIVEEKPAGSGEYYMRDSEGAYPRGERAEQYPQPMSQEDVVELMALDQDLGDSAGRGGYKPRGDEADYG